MLKGVSVLFGIFMILGVQGLDNDLFEDTVNMIEDCQDRPVTLCIKERALKVMDTFPSEYDFGGGLIIRPATGVKRSARYFNPNSLPKEPNAREDLLDEVLMDRIVDYLSTHTFQFKVPEDTIREFKRSLDAEEKQLEEDDDTETVGEGRKKKKKVLPLLLLLKMKAAAIGAIMLKMIALLAFKALVIAKIALLLASIIALKKLVDHKHHHGGYEVIAAHPYEDHGHSFDRSFDTSELPYRGYAPEHMK
ncbi:uncharacterized protein [Atheta coriaria]|uniref:uncharacterized protein n=1 Tax=Dalotia coriaria TaxID=877792 RepID=UPI0031F3FA66